MKIDGRQIAQQILEALKLRVENLTVMPHLAVIRVGDDPAITSYIRQKEKMAKEIGAVVSVYQLPANEHDILEAIDFLQNKGDIHGIILQLPLPKHLNEEKLLTTINPLKDVDGFHRNSPFVVPVASAVMQILEYVYKEEKLLPPHPELVPNPALTEQASGSSKEPALTLDSSIQNFSPWLKNKKIVVVGKGKTGGQPTIDVLRKLDISVQVIDSQTKSPWELTKNADIIISAVGKRGVITENMVKKDVILIGIGMHKGTDDKFYGDYDVDDIKDIASFYTPIPGGVGPVNVAKLMENLVIAAENFSKN